MTPSPSAKGRLVWTLDDALVVYRQMISPFHNAGYLLLVYGSVLAGKQHPHDLDLMAIPWRPSPHPPASCFDSICSRFKLSPAVGPPYIGLMRSWSHTASDQNGRVYDIQFRRSEVTLEESFEYSMRQDEGRLARPG